VKRTKVDNVRSVIIMKLGGMNVLEMANSSR